MLRGVRNGLTGMVGLLQGVIKGLDYRTLNQYILTINRQKSVDRILHEVSNCLNAILDYELFGFYLNDGKSASVWIDPQVYREEVINAVRKDFGLDEFDLTVRHFGNREVCSTDCMRSGNVGLLSFPVSEVDFTARLYLRPRRRMLAYHHEIVGIITKTLEITIGNVINYMRLEHESSLDPLTRAYNRRELERITVHEGALLKRYGGEFSVIMMDIDHFKVINDTYGHKAGDDVLRRVSGIMSDGIRKNDYLIRYGGEEFLILLPNTPFTQACMLAGRLRMMLKAAEIDVDGRAIPVTASFGVAVVEAGADIERTVRNADTMLYAAKQTRDSVMPLCNAPQCTAMALA